MESFLAEISTGLSPLAQGVRLGLLALACFAVYLLTRIGLVGVIRRFAARSATTWDDALVNSEVFRRLAHIVPALLAYYGVHLATDQPLIVTLVERSALAVMVLVAVLALGALLSALNEIYAADVENRHRPIKGYLQVVKIVAYLVAGLSIFSILLDRSPWIFVSGIGAMSAVLLLIFKDTILSLVASIQITSNDMVHVGDWIEMPKYGADGDVIDVALHTVKVQNWDKTITTVPTHALIADSFKNWRGMSRSGGRRIKRAINFDVNSIRFLEPEELDRLGEWALLRDYIRAKQAELEAHNRDAGRNPEIRADVRSLTNIGTMRGYIEAYLRAHPKIHKDMTLLVRQLAAGSDGLPIEVYCFTNDTNWGAYEAIQADLFDHIIALAPEFGLRVFQGPAGADFDRLAPHRLDAERGSA